MLLSAPQASRVKCLLARLAQLEESAQALAAPIVKASSRAELALNRAKALEARVTRLELMQQAKTAEDLAALQDLLQVSRRVQLLENGVVRLTSASAVSPNVQRVMQAMQDLGHEDFELLRVPDGKRYYEEFTLQDRAALLQAASTDALCKTLLFSASGDELDEANLFLLVVNYTCRISASKFKQEIKKLFPNAKTPKQASEEVMKQVLGFPMNGVSIVGGTNKMKIPIVFASSVVEDNATAGGGEVFLGGGEFDVKLKLGNLRQFLTKAKVSVLDVTEKRTDLPATSVAVKEEPKAAVQQEDQPKAAAGKKGEKRALEKNDSDDDTSSAFTFDDLDVRVGLVTKCWRHPDSAKLLCEEIDLGEPSGPRQIASGIQAHYTPEQLEGKRVCVVTNLKPAKLAGFASNGMVLCAVFGDAVRVVEAPSDAALGARLVYEQKKEPAAAPAAVKKKKILEKVLPQLCLDSQGLNVEYAGKMLSVEGVEGKCQVPGGEPGARVS